jgi:hypothetical protein
MRDRARKFRAENSQLPPAFFELRKKLLPQGVQEQQRKERILPEHVELIVVVRGGKFCANLHLCPEEFP